MSRSNSGVAVVLFLVTTVNEHQRRRAPSTVPPSEPAGSPLVVAGWMPESKSSGSSLGIFSHFVSVVPGRAWPSPSMSQRMQPSSLFPSQLLSMPSLHTSFSPLFSFLLVSSQSSERG